MRFFTSFRMTKGMDSRLRGNDSGDVGMEGGRDCRVVSLLAMTSVWTSFVRMLVIFDNF